MKMKYITPSITVMEAIMEPYLLENSTTGSGTSVISGEPEVVIKPTEEIDMGAKDYNAWEAWDSF